MKGSIFKLLADFVDQTYGPDAFEDLVDATDLETAEPFVGPGNYPASDLLALVDTAVTTHEVEVEPLLRAFGRHSFPALARSVPTLLEGLDDPHSLLLNLETVIHTEVRKLDPEASPARFSAVEHGPGVLTLNYESDFGLFALVEGFLDGLADWYGVPVGYERRSTAGTSGSFLVRSGDAVGASATGPGQVATESVSARA